MTDLDERIETILAGLTTDQKVAQLVGVWAGADPQDGRDVALVVYDGMERPESFDEVARDGLGRIDRLYGTRPISPNRAARNVRTLQTWLVGQAPFLPALIQEELVTGLMAYAATAFPAPLSWGATFDPDLVQELGAAIGATARQAGVLLGFGPVLDVVVDPAWGRTEECLSEDPYLVGVLGARWIQGLQSQRVIATAKHFVGHSASRSGRNQAPAGIGPRELADVHLVPFEMACRLAEVGAVMVSYVPVDGVFPVADRHLVTTVLRERLGFTGVVVADLLGITALYQRNGIARDSAEAGWLALRAGVDMEVANGSCFLAVGAAIKTGDLDESLITPAVRRVLRAKLAVGLLDGGGLPDPAGVDLDPPAHRDLARRVAARSVVLLANDGILPLPASGGRLAVVGPISGVAAALLGSYSFVNHIECRYDVDIPPGIKVPTVLSALQEEFAGWRLDSAAEDCWQAVTDSDITTAVELASNADVVIAVVGDKAGIFGLGTVGEGSDVTSLALPGRQPELLQRLLDTGVPVVVVVVSGRPYALDTAVDRAVAIVQAFLPGQEGADAVAGVLSGRINPSGRLPVSMPWSAGSAPYTYRQSRYGRTHDFSEVPSQARWPFGFGLSYTSFAYLDSSSSSAVIPIDGVVELSVTVANTGDRAGADVLQLYVTDLCASVARPTTELVGFCRVPLEAGARTRVTFVVHADRLSFTGPDLQRIVEPGGVVFRLARSAEETIAELPVTLSGCTRVVGSDRILLTDVRLAPLPAGGADEPAAQDERGDLGHVELTGPAEPGADRVGPARPRAVQQPTYGLNPDILDAGHVAANT